MVIEEACWICGEWFVKRGNQRYCCEECRKIAEKQREKEADRRYRESVKRKKTESIDKSGLSMDDMLDLMARLSKERGRIVQYGEVQQEILTGKLNVKGGKTNG